MCRNTYGHALQLVLCGGGCGEGDGETLYRKKKRKMGKCQQERRC